MTRSSLLAAVDDLRGWALGPACELAVVLPVHGDRVGEPRLVAAGDAVSVRVTPAVVLGAVLRSGVTSYALVHTHLTDSPPSPADGAVTRRLVSASAIVGLSLVAHLVVTPDRIHECLAAPLASSP